MYLWSGANGCLIIPILTIGMLLIFYDVLSVVQYRDTVISLIQPVIQTQYINPKEVVSLRNATHLQSILAGDQRPEVTDEDASSVATKKQNNSNNSTIPGSVSLTKQESSSPKMKIILKWSQFPKTINNWFNSEMTRGTKPFQRCAYTECSLEEDRNLADVADMIFFSNNQFENWPSVRHPHQLYVHELGERPGPWHSWLKDYEGRFNLTYNYREDADIRVVQNHYEKKTGMDGTEQYIPKVPLANRSRSVVWVVSHCQAASKRDEYMHELSRYIDVDIYGLCGNLSCSKDVREECNDMFERTYKFYIAFENGICQDYITEKLDIGLKKELVPIVLGGGNYTARVPPGSVIDARDFPAPRRLAEYMKRLMTHEEEYYGYFHWKVRYEKRPPSAKEQLVCIMCEAVHTNKYHRPAHTNLNDWWFSGCDNELVDRWRVQQHW